MNQIGIIILISICGWLIYQAWVIDRIRGKLKKQSELINQTRFSLSYYINDYRFNIDDRVKIRRGGTVYSSGTYDDNVGVITYRESFTETNTEGFRTRINRYIVSTKIKRDSERKTVEWVTENNLILAPNE